LIFSICAIIAVQAPLAESGSSLGFSPSSSKHLLEVFPLAALWEQCMTKALFKLKVT